MKTESLEQEILFDNRAPKSTKRMALFVLLLKENLDTESIARIVGVSERQVRNYRRVHNLEGSRAMLKNSRYRPVSELEAHKDTIKRNL